MTDKQWKTAWTVMWFACCVLFLLRTFALEDSSGAVAGMLGCLALRHIYEIRDQNKELAEAVNKLAESGRAEVKDEK